ncbi:DUF6207 family protein [Streptomyces sp. NPDC048248]|uniref:DUF6207 family protein n=1 Tax=Streptomyces sp. NPDC048248 TaxID=3365523 RepID=UPI00371ED977
MTHEEHLREPGLVVIDSTAASDETTTQVAGARGGPWCSSGPSVRGLAPTIRRFMCVSPCTRALPSGSRRARQSAHPAPEVSHRHGLTCGHAAAGA